MNGHLIFIAALVSIHLFTTIAPVQARDDTAETERFRSVFISESRVRHLKESIAAGREPTVGAFQSLRQYATESLGRESHAPETWYVPGFYRDAEGHRKAKNGLRDDAGAAYAMALYFRMTGDERYARSAVRLIDAWPATVQTLSHRDDSTLSFSYHFPAMIFAADLLRHEGVWPRERQDAFRRFLREKALPMNTMSRQNNWGNWGLVLALSCAVFLEDEALFDRCAERWRHFIADQIAEDGHLPHEVHREGGTRGIWYSHFTLMPQTIAAEILKVNGVDLFDFTAPSGRTLKSAFGKVAAWTERPESFPFYKGDAGNMLGVQYFSYFEILNPLWPNESASRLLEASRPLTANHSAPFLTFTHGQELHCEER